VINAFVHNRWLDGNAPMFTAFQDRIEILSRGNLPPKQTLEDTAGNALRQIEEKRYDTDLKERGIPEGNILKYGFAFQGKEVLIRKG